MPYGLPAATTTVRVTRALRLRHVEAGLVQVRDDDGHALYQSLPAGRQLTLLFAGADQDGWGEPTVIVNDPLRGSYYRLAVPRECLYLPAEK